MRFGRDLRIPGSTHAVHRQRLIIAALPVTLAMILIMAVAPGSTSHAQDGAAAAAPATQPAPQATTQPAQVDLPPADPTTPPQPDDAPLDEAPAVPVAIDEVVAPVSTPGPPADVAAPSSPNLPPLASLPQVIEENPYPEDSPYGELGAYELEVLRPIFRRRGFIAEHSPAGRPICETHYAQIDIFTPEDPFPDWANAIHSTTKSRIVERAVSLKRGDAWNDVLVSDIERQLRNGFIYSLVTIVPVVSAESAQCVDMLVMTKDIWSLRITFAPDGTFSSFNRIDLGVTETNLLGTNQSLGIDVSLFGRERSVEFGPTFIARRFAGSDFDVTGSLRLVFDPLFDGLSGSASSIDVRRPLRDTTSRFGWYGFISHRNAVDRRYNGTAVDTAEGLYGLELPLRWRQRDANAEGGLIHSFGSKVKHNVTTGAYVSTRRVQAEPLFGREPSPWGSVVGPFDWPSTPGTVTPSDSPIAGLTREQLDEALTDFEQRELPRAELSIGPLLGYELFYNRFFTLENYNSFAVSEEIRFGLNVLADVRLAEPAFGADDRYVSVSLTASYTLPISDDSFAMLSAYQGARAGDRVSDIETQGSLRLVSPAVVGGRFVARMLARNINRNEANVAAVLDTLGGFRGYGHAPPIGANYIVSNFEWRSLPIEVLSARIGAVLFYDIGAAWDDDEDIGLKHTVGLGIRLYVPQIMSNILRIDVAFPVVEPLPSPWFGNVPGPEISFQLGQIF